MDYFSLSGSKHDEERVYIILKNNQGKEIVD